MVQVQDAFFVVVFCEGLEFVYLVHCLGLVEIAGFYLRETDALEFVRFELLDRIPQHPLIPPRKLINLLPQARLIHPHNSPHILLINLTSIGIDEQDIGNLAGLGLHCVGEQVVLF